MSAICPSHGVMLPGACRCAEVLAETDFRDATSFAEYEMSRSCQYCQDVGWMGFTVNDGVFVDHNFLRRGVVFAHSPESGDCALLPFVFGAPGRPVAWDLSAVVVVGQVASGVDPSQSLSSLGAYLATHRLGVAAVDSPSHPLLHSLRGCAVVLSFQSQPLEEFVDACPALRESVPALHQLEVYADDSQRRVDLVDLVLACAMDPTYDPEASGPPDALRLCAWTACALHAPDGKYMLLDGVLAPHRRLVGPAPRQALSAPLH